MAFNNGYIGRSPGDSSVVIARQSYQPTGVQTDFTFSANYDVGYLDAYINGVRLIEGLDYTASDGSVVGLTSFAQNGDVVELIAYKAFTIADVRQSYGNFTVGANLEVVGNISAGGSVTAPSFYGDLTGDVTGDVTGNADTATTATYATTAGIATYATTAGIATYTSEWILESGNGSDYGISGPGLTGTENDPTFYLTRGQQYKFTNNLGAHPFRIQSTPNGSVGAQYNDGITNNDVTNGTLTWNVQFDAPDIVYYQCTVHPNMGGKIYIVDAGVASDVSVNTTGIITATSFSGNVTGNVTGTATTATNVTVADESSDTSCNVLFVTAATGNLPPKSGTNLTFNSSTGTLTATEFSGGGSGLTGVDATTLDSIDSGSFLRSDANDSFSGVLAGSTGSRIEFANVNTSYDTAGEIPTGVGAFLAGADNGTSTATPANMNIYSWYGVGFGPTISGQTVPVGQLSHLFNVRNGDATFIGSLTCVNVNSTSDINLKKDIEVITDATDLIKQLNGVKFAWKKNDEKSVGVIAQEVEKVLPELISEKQDTGEKSVNYSGLVGVLIEAVKELSARVEKLENR